MLSGAAESENCATKTRKRLTQFLKGAGPAAFNTRRHRPQFSQCDPTWPLTDCGRGMLLGSERDNGFRDGPTYVKSYGSARSPARRRHNARRYLWSPFDLCLEAWSDSLRRTRRQPDSVVFPTRVGISRSPNCMCHGCRNRSNYSRGRRSPASRFSVTARRTASKRSGRDSVGGTSTSLRGVLAWGFSVTP